MQTVQVITFGILLSLLTLNKAQSDCNYFQNLEPRKTYYVYNQGYPNFYRTNYACTWRLRSPYVIKINCDINIPKISDCMQDKLTVQFDGKVMNTYCGMGKFENKGINATINFNSPYGTTGGKFLCEIKTIEFDEDNCQCGWKDLSYIVGGKETGVNEYPMMAGLVDSVLELLYCGATIISQSHITTAAHCLIGRNPNKIGVIIGEHDDTTGLDTNVTKLYRISNCVIHPQYDGNHNDIAVCQIIGKFEYGVKIGPVCLPFYHKNDLFTGSYVKLLGWGMMSFGGAKSHVLREVDVEIISLQQCAESYNKWIPDSQICTYTAGKDACQMDSGGPVLWENPITHKLVLIGIISNGVGCASELPAINTRVGNYIPWIMSVTPGVQYCKME